MHNRRATDKPSSHRPERDRLSERFLKTASVAALWFISAALLMGVSFVPATVPDNANFWRITLGVPAVLLGALSIHLGRRLSERHFQLYIELCMIPAIGLNLMILLVSPATIALLFNLIATLLFAGYFLRRFALALTTCAAIGVALTSLFVEPASQTPHLGAFLVVFIPTLVITTALLHIQNSETLDALHATTRLARTDPLTGLANLRALKSAARRRFTNRKVINRGELTALLLIDLDNFKSANTKHGHVGGDYALRMIAKQMRRVAPENSTLARVGGDEFAVLFPSESRARAEESGEMFRAAVRAAVSVAEIPGIDIGAAVGCAIHPDDGRDLDELLDRADKELYARKGEKRHVVPNLESAVDEDTRPAWLDEIESTPIEVVGEPRGLDHLTGGELGWLGTRTLYARTSALAFAIGSVILGASMLMPDAYPDPTITWWMIMFGGLILSGGILLVNAQPQTLIHAIFDLVALAVLGFLIAGTGGLVSTAAPLLILLATSQAWFWETRLVVLRVVGPVVVACSPLLYQSLGSGTTAELAAVTLFAESAILVAVVGAMYFDRHLLTALQAQAIIFANTDPLTGVSNRRAFDAHVNELLSADESSSFAIVMLDLDNFKQVNTNRGHRAGDAVLAAIGEELRSVSREDDMIARVGGDEFAAVLSGVGIDGARALAERYVNTISTTTAAREAGVGASAGFALHPLHGDSLDELVFTADSALMAVKASGKGSARVARVVSAVN
ncbi:MAG: GGDEF domain-containing protein [Solirubrobacterales bacterium]